MSAISDLLGKNGAIEQLFLWNVVGQVVGTILQPALTTLQQDVSSRHPVNALDPSVAADLAARGIITVSAGTAEAGRNGVDPARFQQLLTMHTVRLSPADLATAVLRSALTEADARQQAAIQGVDAAMLQVLTDLAADAPGPEQLATALRRGLLPRSGSGPGEVSYDQGIAESRLAPKWGNLLYDLSAAILSPPDAAEAVIRSFITADQGQKIAGQSGVDASTFALMTHLAGDAPGPQQLAEALRRGLIAADGTGAGSTSFTQGIAEGRLANKWAPVIEGLAQEWPTPTDALDASVKGVFDAADGKAMYEKLGGDPQFYDWLLWSVGNSPTPLEAASLAFRGIIPWNGTGINVLSYQQAVAESRYRNKWADAYKQLAEPVPPVSTVVSLYAHRNITEDQAHTYLNKNGVQPDLAAAYIAEADYEAVSDYRGLTQSAVIDMYVGHVITQDQALQILEALHVSEQAAKLLLSYADLKYAVDSINQSVQRIATLFTSRKIATATARDALNKLGIAAVTVDELISDWEIQAAANVKVLTEAQIVDGWYYGVISQDEAVNYLGAVGYTAYDAWTLLSVKAKGPLPDKPANQAAPPSGAVIPGVT